jgi:hypothetical protein
MRRVVMLALALAGSVAGCAGDLGGSDIPGDAGTNNDAQPTQCAVSYDPVDPVASSILPIRAYTTVVNSQGVLTFSWSVTFNGSPVSFTQEAADGSQIGFIAATPGVYSVYVDIGGPSTCPSGASANINVADPAANNDVFRLRTVPAPNLAPPQETFIQVKGGADADRAIALDSGIATTGLVKNGATNTAIPAYLKFMPTSMPTAFSEVFASSTGAYGLRVLPLNHDVLVIPTATNLAPKLVPWTAVPMTTQLVVGPGTVVTGIVRGPSGVGFGGAKVQLYAGGVPSTLGTSAADGSFSVRTDFPANASAVTVKVTPPPASGLPRLEATSAFNLATAIQINYSGALTTCDLANVPVRRAAANQPGAGVTIVGTLAGVAGTIGGVNATNRVHVSATADGAGRLPSTLVPRGSLSAVTVLSASDHAASSLDTSACSVAQIDAPAMTAVAGTTKKDATTAIAGVRIEAEPAGVLALAGVLPVQVTSTTGGGFSLPLAPGGRYNVRFTDPQARAAPLVASDVAPLGVPTNAVLPKALAISGEVSVVNNSNPVIGASVQILCATCSGLDITRPIAETATDTVSRYRIAVPDPGTM